MKKIVKIAFALISLAFVSQVFALECGGLNLQFLGSNGQPHCSAEEAGAADRARMNRYGANTGTVFVQRAPVYVHQPVIVHTMPQGYGYRDCTAGEVIQRDLLMAGRGLIAGLLIGDSSRAAGIGAGTGLLFSITGSCRVAVRQVASETIGNQGVLGTPPGTIHVPGSCSVDDNPKLQNLRGLTKEQCAEIAGTQKVQGQTPSSIATYGTTPTVKDGHTCSVFDKKGQIIADFLDAAKNPKKIVVATGAECAKEKAEVSAQYAQK